MKTIRSLLILLAIGAGAAALCEACTRIGGAVTRARIERTHTR